MKNEALGSAALITSAAIYGSFGVMIRLMSAELNTESQIILRYLIALVILVGLISVSRAKLKVQKHVILPMVGFALLMQLSIYLFTIAAEVISITSLIGSFYIGSIVTASVLAGIVYREKLTSKRVLATLIAGGGLWMLTSQAGSKAGLLLAGAAGALECLTQAVRKSVTTASKGLTALVAIAGILLLTLGKVWVSGVELVLPTSIAIWGVTMLFGLMAVGVNIAVTYGFRKLQIALGSVIMSMEIVFGVVFGLLFLGMVPTEVELVSAGLIILAVAIQNMRLNPKNRALEFVRNILEN